MLTATETEELVAIAFANPNKIWNIDGNSQKWESLVNFKGKRMTIQGYGIRGVNLESDILNTGWVQDIN